MATGLVAPAFLYMVIVFVIPVGLMLSRSVDDSLVNKFLIRTFQIFNQWDQVDLPSERLYEAMFLDISTADKLVRGRSSLRMVAEVSGWRGLMLKSAREFPSIVEGPYKDAMIAIDKRWGDVRYWRSLGAMSSNYTLGYFLYAIDLRLDGKRNVIAKPENRSIYLMLWWRTLKISLIVTVCCLLLGYPLAYLMANHGGIIRSVVLICVLIPFAISVLVIASAGMLLLPQQGVINDVLVSLGILADENRVMMVYNFTGSVIVMTHTLLPYMVLPLYSVMRRISRDQVKAAQGLGVNPFQSFMRVYLPLSMPGVGGGSVLVFVLAFGNYVIPGVVGGSEGRMIGGLVSGTGGVPGAIAVIMLAAILVILSAYDRLTGSAGLKIKPSHS